MSKALAFQLRDFGRPDVMSVAKGDGEGMRWLKDLGVGIVRGDDVAMTGGSAMEGGSDS